MLAFAAEQKGGCVISLGFTLFYLLKEIEYVA